MGDNPASVDLDHQRVRHLLERLRRRTPEEVVIGALLFAPAFTPEMREALRLLHLERSTEAVHNAAPTARFEPSANRRVRRRTRVTPSRKLLLRHAHMEAGVVGLFSRVREPWDDD
jgi:hypothetical protein